MEKIKESFKQKWVTIFAVLLILFIIMQISTQVDFIKFYTKGIVNTGTEISFVFPFVNKNIANDTLFTIAIGNNILQNGFTNTDTLTWHENLEFPHSRSF